MQRGQDLFYAHERETIQILEATWNASDLPVENLYAGPVGIFLFFSASRAASQCQPKSEPFGNLKGIFEKTFRNLEETL